MEIYEYESKDGKNHYQEWFKGLPSFHAYKVSEALRRMEAGNLGDHKPLKDGVYEHRIHSPTALRVYFAKDGKDIILLLAGGSKTRQSKDIALAKGLWAEYKMIKNNNLIP